MRDVRAVILSNRETVSGYFKMTLAAPFIAKNAMPGQFVMVRLSHSMDPLLRRPLGIHRLKAQGSRLNGIEILYEVVGRGTGILAKKRQGDFVDILGPLGNGFTLPLSTIHYPLSTILIAGGIGVAPLFFLAEKLQEIKNQKMKIKIIVFIGAKTKRLILCEEEFKKLGAEVHIATDDGTRGYRGFVSKLFEKFLRTTNNGRRTTIYACGPQPMLQRIFDVCKPKGIECQVSLEREMACGFGACLGCAVEVKDGFYKLACKDGPVFNIDELVA